MPYDKMKKSDLQALALKRGIESKELKNDDVRTLLMEYDVNNMPYDCDSCLWYRPDAELREFNMPGMPGDRADICKYIKTQLRVKVRGCPHYQKLGEMGTTSDARINASKRRAVGE